VRKAQENKAAARGQLSAAVCSCAPGTTVRGFSLIELMIVLAIIAVLASIAFPGYQSYVLRGNRGDAQRLMTTIANRESQYLIDARSYTAQLAASGLNISGLDGWTCTDAQCSNGSYLITVTLGATPADGYTITGTPVGRQTRDGTLQLLSSGTRTRLVSGVDKGW
jgi:type IV pilus assembly protein PilE